jgi:hypothetical protein
MSLAQPVEMSRAAWLALRDGLVEPARTGAGTEQLLALTRLSAAWGSPQVKGERATVWLAPEDATALRQLLDTHPELAPLLGT